MRIGIDTMKADGRRVRVTFGDAWAAAAAQGALEGALEALDGELTFELVKRRVEVHGTVSATSAQPCDRCGEPVHVSVTADVDLVYLPEKPAGQGEQQLAEDELDVGWYTGDEVDVSDVLSEALALEAPVRILCQDTDACDARTQALLDASGGGATGHPGFSALAGLRRDA